MGVPSELRQMKADRQMQWNSIRAAQKAGPLQSLTPRELCLDDLPMTIYPHRRQRKVRAWVRFGPEAIRVDAKIVRSTALAAGIEFRCEDETMRCWVWGNAVQLDEE